MPETVDRATAVPVEHPEHLTVHYEPNPDGWVTAQVVEIPAAISQGRTRDEAWINVLDALHDLTHEPTPAERIATRLQIRLLEPLLSVIRR
jgi:predicted RNase H-like HicB family nuclease